MKLTLAKKIFLFVISILVVFLIQQFAILSNQHEELMKGKKSEIKSIVDAMHSSVLHYAQLAKQGVLKNEEAKKRAAEMVQSSRFQGDNYIFIFDYDYKMVAHPKTKLLGKVMKDTKDKRGSYFFKELAKVAKDSEGFVNYFWERHGEVVPKLSYAKGIDEWNWVIGSGIYIDDVEEIYAGMRNFMMLFFGIILVGALIVTFLFSNYINKKIISKLLGQANEITEAVINGKLDQRCNIDETNFEFKSIMQGVNSLIDAFVAPINVTAEYIERISKGDMPAKITEVYHGDFNEIKISLNQCIDVLNSFIADMNMMATEHDKGDIDILIPAHQFQGAYNEMANGVNNMVNGHINLYKKAMACVEGFGKGDFDSPLEQFPGKKAFINETIEVVRRNLKEVSSQVSLLINASKDGKLDIRANGEQFEGDWQHLVSGINNILEAMIAPINEVVEVMKKMEKGDLRDKIRGDYKGDFSILKNAINNTLDSINNILAQVQGAVDQVNSGAGQVSEASQSLSQGASEQASSVEEISSSMQEIGSQTKLNAENAHKANSISQEARGAAETGNIQMTQLVDAMTKINESSKNVSKIIKAIDEIAFQTNVLALNAAVEAARAGEHGRGFSVVAEEVRDLAERSAKAARETAEMIDDSVKKAEEGTVISKTTSEVLIEIVSNATKVTDIVGEIAAASNEQAQGISQVNIGLNQVEAVTQQVTANSEETAAASEELSGQAEQLKQLINQFKLSHTASLMQAQPRLNTMAVRDDNFVPIRENSHTRTSDVISLDDGNFGKY